MSRSEIQSYLDTSIVWKILFGTSVYRDYLRRSLGDRLYVGRFVDMEFKRGVILPLIDFLNTLFMPHIHSIGDAEKAWSNRFQGREVKLLLALTGDIFDRYKLDRANPRHKQRGIMALASAIKSFDRVMRRRFTDPSRDRTHCPRGAQPLLASLCPARLKQDFNAYADLFENEADARETCHIEHFFDYFRRDLTACVQHVKSLPDLRKHDDVRKLAGEIKKVQEDTAICTCGVCEKLGDVVIVVGAPRNMQVETLDQSFGHWCSPTRQPYRLHDSELKYLNKLNRTGCTS